VRRIERAHQAIPATADQLVLKRLGYEATAVALQAVDSLDKQGHGNSFGGCGDLVCYYMIIS
jgi:hypothetical protein